MKLLASCLLFASLVLPGCHGSRIARPALTGLVITDLVRGSGAIAKNGTVVAIQYEGRLTDGTLFDSSRRRGPFTFTIGTGAVIRGLDLGMTGMRVGGMRRLEIPPDMGYGVQGFPPVIPPNSRLVFEVELVDVQSPTL